MTQEPSQAQSTPDQVASTSELEWNQRFAHGIFDWAIENRITARELAMLRVMNSITEKPGWATEIFDDKTAALWQAEAVASERLMSYRAWNWCLRELREKAAVFVDSGRVNVFDAGPSISKSDPVGIGNGLKTIVQGIVESTNWEIREDDQVLNIAHPSLNPLVYGTTQVLDKDERVDLDRPWEKISRGRQSVVAPHLLEEIFHRGGKDPTRAPEILRDREDETGAWDPLLDDRWQEEKPWRYSTRFQWLPCDVGFIDGEDDCQVKIESYIDGLNPTTHLSLYQTIEGILSASIRPWNDVVVHGTPRCGRWRDPILNVGLGRSGPRIRAFQFDYMYPLSPNGYCWRQEGNFYKELFQLSEAWDTLEPKSRESALEEIVARMERAESLSFWGSSDHVWGRYRPEILERLEVFRHPDAGVLLSFDDWKSGRLPKKTIRWEFRAPGDTSSEEDCSEEAREATRKAPHLPRGWSRITPEEKFRICPHCPCTAPRNKWENARRIKWAKAVEGYRIIDPYQHQYLHAQIQRDFRQQGLQVYVKIQSIELTPEKPRYERSDWTIEGLLNERIIASSVYVFDMENIADGASMSFGVHAEFTIDRPEPPESELCQTMMPVYAIEGLTDADDPVTDGLIPHFQKLGSVSLREGRMIAFPNTLQYCLGPAELRDRTGPGHIRFLTLCLADPNYRLISTGRVVPQSYDWWMEEVFPRAFLTRKGIPREVIDMIAEEARGPIITPRQAGDIHYQVSREKERMMAELNNKAYYLALTEHIMAG